MHARDIYNGDPHRYKQFVESIVKQLNDGLTHLTSTAF